MLKFKVKYWLKITYRVVVFLALSLSTLSNGLTHHNGG